MSKDPPLSREAAESNRKVTSNLPWTATLEAKRAGWERGWTSDHLEPFLWVLADSEYHVLPHGEFVPTPGLEGGRAGMSERAYLLIVSVVFLLFTLGNVFRFIFILLGLEPAWQSLIAATVTGFLSYEGFHFARKVPPKG